MPAKQVEEVSEPATMRREDSAQSSGMVKPSPVSGSLALRR